MPTTSEDVVGYFFFYGRQDVNIFFLFLLYNGAMNIFSFKKIFFLGVLGALAFPLFSFAYTAPSVTLYKSSVSSMNSGQLVTFSWTLSNAGGYSFVIPCTSGIKLKKSDGSSMDCDTPISTIFTTNDAIDVIINNVSGGVKSVTGRLIPKDTAGVEYTNGARVVSVSVATLPQPITSFTSTDTNTVSGEPMDVSWSSDFLDGVNVQIECRSEITVSSPSYTDANMMPCGKIIFLSDLPGSGSLSLSFTNSTNQPIPYTIKLYPAVTANTSYDGTHAVSLTLNVASDVIPDPVVTYFTASTTAVISKDVVTLAWGTKYAVGINIKFSCSPYILGGDQTIMQIFPCDTYISETALGANGQTTISFNNSDVQDQAVIITLVPSKKTGTYDALRGKSIALTVRPYGAAPIVSPSVIPSPTPATTVMPSPFPGVKTVLPSL